MELVKFFESLNNLTIVKPNDSGLKIALKKGLQKVRSLFTKIWDPLISFNLKGNTLLIPLSHRLPNFISEWPLSDAALPRLCKFISEELNYLKVIDVGANIGDTVSLVSSKISGEFLCIEPSKKYFPILRTNTENNDNIIIDNHLIGERCERISGQVKNTNAGTASFLQGGDNSFEIISLDGLIDNFHKNFINANVIKVDTDGYDYKVLRGAESIIKNSKPALFFEISPGCLIEYAKEDPYSIFPFLVELGYQQFLIYDNNGFMISSFFKTNLEVINGIIDYALNKTTVWLDVIGFHNDYSDLFIKFNNLEKVTINEFAAKIPNYKRNSHKVIDFLFNRSL
jgi:FkbM family methyltransferase